MTGLQNGRTRRLRRGTKTEDYLAALAGEDVAAVPTKASSSSSSSSSSSPAISSIDSPFQVQEYLAMLVAENPHDIQRLIQIPRWRRTSPDGDSNDKGKNTAQSSDDSSNNGDDRTTSNGQSSSTDDDNEDRQETNTDDNQDNDEEYEYVDRDVWLYEHLRRLAIDLSQPFVVTLQEHCTRETCPEMKAGEWLYLCAAHATANETECCAIDYITHTLDGATALLNSSRYFPSRINIPPTSLKHFTSIARRLYRIFAHAWYHHREIFDICESSTSLYERFLALSLEYDLVPRELLTIPSQSATASGSNEESTQESADAESRDATYGRGIRLNGNNNQKEQEAAKEEEEQNQIQRRILEKRVLGPGYTQSGGGGSGRDANGSAGGGLNDEDEDDDSSEESSDDDEQVAMPTASLAGMSLYTQKAGGSENGDIKAAAPS